MNEEQAGSRSANKRRLQNILLALASALFGLFCLEIAVRITLYSQRTPDLGALNKYRERVRGREAKLGDLLRLSSDPLLVFEMIPELDVSFYQKAVHINSAGFRDDEFTTDPEAIRIAAVGDSGTFGWRIDKADRYTEALEETLNKASAAKKFDVLNFGIPGYNSVMEWEICRKYVLPLKPHVLVLQFEGNDMDLPNFMRKRDNLLSPLKVYLPDFALSRLAFLRKERLQADAGLGGLADVPSLVDGRFVRYAMDERTIPDDMRVLVGNDNCTSAIRAIGTMCREQGIHSVLLLNPAFVEHYGAANTAAKDSFYSQYISAAEAAGFVIADPSMPLRDFIVKNNMQNEDLWIDPTWYDTHATPPRHTLMAQSVAVMLAGMPDIAQHLKTEHHDVIASHSVERAQQQWMRALREIPHIGQGSVSVSLKDEQRFTEGWLPVEGTTSETLSRWCGNKAIVHLPSATRVIIQAASRVPEHFGFPDQKFEFNGKKVKPVVVRRGENVWFDLSVPENLAMKRGDSMELKLRCVEVPRDARDAKSSKVGIEIKSITLEPLTHSL